MIEALRGQFELAWALTDLHLSALTEEDFLWEPAAVVWTMHRDAAGSWYPDWAETEPNPIPVPTVGWLTWHIIYWWSAAADELAGRPARPPGEIGWPGPMNSVRAVRSLCDRWRQILATKSGDKLTALISMTVFAAQHHMHWVSLGLGPGWNSSAGSEHDLNRLGFWLGAGAQTDVDAGAEGVHPADIATCLHLGRRVAEVTAQLNAGRAAMSAA